MQAVQRCLAGLAKCVPREGRLPLRSSSRPIVTAVPVMASKPPAAPGAPDTSTSSYGFKSGQTEFAVPGLTDQSPWNQKSMEVMYPPLSEDTAADVVVVGAGIAGLSCAYNLSKEGKRVVVLESRVRGGGQTGRTTAHIMTWLDDYYYECEKMHGLDKTRLVAQSLHSAVDYIERVSKEEGIDCKFERLDGYLVPHATGESPQPTSSTRVLSKELDAAIRAGLADTESVNLGGGPEVGGYTEALRFSNNAEFHPLMYLEGLADAVVRHGGRIYEKTKFWSAEGSHVRTAGGNRITCDYVVLATNSPINHNLAVHARQLPYRTYAVGLKIRKDKYKKALYWDTAEPYHYVRIDDWDRDHYLMIVGGEDHKTGSLWPYDPYARLIKYAKSRWTNAGEVLRCWNGQGRGILGRHNPWAEVYSPSRAPPARSLVEIADEGLTTTVSFAERVLPKFTLDYDLAPGTGAIVQKGVHKVALYCDPEGKKHAFSAVCKHMGCLLHWNSIERTFDCPCHGSHFDCYGKCINGPAKADLDEIEW